MQTNAESSRLLLRHASNQLLQTNVAVTDWSLSLCRTAARFGLKLPSQKIFGWILHLAIASPGLPHKKRCEDDYDSSGFSGKNRG